ncbi:MAG: alkaline phosphatase family protein [Verrucomicrobia bacterium]|nr:alkaline phosphatase family protein [Verrucomicrobiota bacterium]
MKPILPLFIMLDAAGWEILRDRDFLTAEAPHRRKLESVFGYSSACVPSIVSGRWPDSHRNWSYFVYDPPNSPFRKLKGLRLLPNALTSRRIVRRILTRLLKRGLGFRGYFDLYNIPFQYISLFDFSEKKSPFTPGGMNRGENIFDFLTQRGIPYYMNDIERPEPETRDQLIERIRSESIDFAFVYWPGLDGLMHLHGNDSPRIVDQLAGYQDWIGAIMAAAREHYADLRLFVFSDHGMANCDEHLDLRAVIERLPLRFGEDYTAVYDSTMARFWFHRPAARGAIEAALRTVPEGRVIEDAELAELHTLFEDRYFGELIFLLREGVLLVPSHMGERPIRAMHGYHPADRHSKASLLTNRTDVPESITAIPHIYQLMTTHALAAQAANGGAPA